MARRLFSLGTGTEPPQSTAAHQRARMQIGAKRAAAPAGRAQRATDLRLQAAPES